MSIRSSFAYQSKTHTTRIQIETLKTALELFKRKHSFYPPTQQGLKALVEKPTTGKIPDNYLQVVI